jgi:hypothetical protein
MQIGLSAHTESGLAIGGSWLRKYPCRFDFYLNNTHISTAGDDLRKELFHKVYREHSKEIFFYIQKSS